MTQLDLDPNGLDEALRAGAILLDIRDEEAYERDHIPGALRVDPSVTADTEEFLRICRTTQEDMTAESDAASGKYRPLVLLCRQGQISRDMATLLREEGIEASHLEGGYGRWVYAHAMAAAEDEGRRELAVKSIQTRFHKDLFSKFAKAVRTYDLVQEGDHIAVCISGGKDSMCMAMLFMELKRHDKFPFDLTFLVMDPGYSPYNRGVIESNARLLGIPITIFDSPIFDAVVDVPKSPCYLCARMRRGYLYSRAKELGCNKIALGHHYDDVIETVLMGMLYSGQFQGMMPRLRSSNFEGMELIRPMYFIREEDICRWRDACGLHFIQCACRFTDTCTISGEAADDGRTGHKRLEVKHLIAELKKTNPFVEANLFRSMERVPLSKLLSYKDAKGLHSFMDDYERGNEM